MRVLDALGADLAETANDGGDEFDPAPKSWEVGDGEIHIWRVELDAHVDDGVAAGVALSRERVCARKRRSQAAMRVVLAGYLNCRPADIRLEPGQFGKPSLAAGQGDLQFNLSRSGGRCVIVIGRLRPRGHRTRTRLADWRCRPPVRAVPRTGRGSCDP